MPLVQAMTTATLERLTAEVEEDFVQATRRAFRNVSKVLRTQSVVAAAGDQLPLFNLDDVQTATTAWRTEMQDLTKKLRAVFEAGAYGLSGAIEQSLGLPDQMRGVTVIPEVINEAGTHYLAQASNRIARLGDAAWGDIRGTLTEGFHKGETIPELTRRVRDQVQFAEIRARAVARTETIMAANGGAFTQAQAQPEVLRPTNKQWLSTKDGRTRLTHRIANGQQQPLDGTFKIGGASVRFPADPLGPAAETVNCRCTVLFDVDDVDVECPGTMTIEQAKAHTFEAETRNLLTKNIPDMSASDIEATTRAFTRVNDTFPGILQPGNISVTEHDHNSVFTAIVADWDADRAMRNFPIRGSIRVDDRYAKEGITDMWRTNVVNHWWPAIRPESYGWDATVTHELGHAIHDESKAAWAKAHPNEPYSIWNLIAERLNRDHIEEGHNSLPMKDSLLRVLGHPSNYSMRNINEWMAESFTEGMLAADPSEVSRTLIAVLKEILATEVATAASA